jgi:hypothetical protein
MPRTSRGRPVFLGACLTLVLALFSAIRQSTLLYDSPRWTSTVLWQEEHAVEQDDPIFLLSSSTSSDVVTTSDEATTTAASHSVTPLPAAAAHNMTSAAAAQLVWLVSFPNSGTSYTMMLVERASNRSTATHHGREVANTQGWSTPVSGDDGGGPYWEGTVHLRGRLRALPLRHVLTKTHCGSRCVNCGPETYRTSLPAFVQDCQRTTAYTTTAPASGSSSSKSSVNLLTNWVPLTRVAKVLWLMRHPLENIVARYHLERRNWLRKAAAKDPVARRMAPFLYNNATGFQHWCRYLDETFDAVPFVADPEEHESNNHMGVLPWSLWSRTPCRGEFYRYAQWHNRVGQMLLGDDHANGTDATATMTPPVLHDRPVLHWYYEDYAQESSSGGANATLPVDRLLEFMEQERVGPIKEFRQPMPVYRSTHYSDAERRRIWRVLQALATPDTWQRLQVYYEDHRQEVRRAEKEDTATAVSRAT